MREPIIIRSGRLVRPADMPHDEWGAALARHRRARRWSRARGLIDGIYDLALGMLGDLDDIDDRRIDGLRDLAMSAMRAGERSRFADTSAVREPVERLRQRLHGYARRVEEDPVVRYARLHAKHDRFVDLANRIIILADLVGENNLWALSDTNTLLIEGRHIVRMAHERWQGFPMSNELRETLAQLEIEGEKLNV